jgi:hypothetical protein
LTQGRSAESAILTPSTSGGHSGQVEDDYDDATLALTALFDIRRDVARIAEALTDGGEEEETEDEPDE